MKPANDPINLTETEAAEIAAECVAAIDWQTDHFILQMDTETITTADMIEAITPKRPATLRVLGVMCHGAAYQAMKGIVPAGESPRIVLMPTACKSIAANLASWGFQNEADQIISALERSDRAAIKH
jgi:hypothetical protein